MRIKNTRELVLRAQGHARLDHISQGTYGDASCNGFVEFKGCAIGCLATPHRKSELRAFIRRLGSHWGGKYALSEDGADQLPRLRSEFGICPALARCAETIFESLENHSDAINFIPVFAKALPEGVNIGPREVRRAWLQITEHKGEIMPMSAWPDRLRGDHAVNLGSSWNDAPSPETVRDRFLAWLGSLA